MVVSGKAQGDEGYKLKETREEKEEIYTTEQPSMLSLSLKQVKQLFDDNVYSFCLYKPLQQS